MANQAEESEEEALQRALKFLNYRARSEAEVRTKLSQCGFTPKVIETTLRKLRALNLLNDESFAWNWVRRRMMDRGYGPLRLRMELRKKGIPGALIARIIGESFEEEESKERARALLGKRFRGKDLTDMKTLRRAVAFLQRRGYGDAVIAEIVKRSPED
jgi:regulatory protein